MSENRTEQSYIRVVRDVEATHGVDAFQISATKAAAEAFLDIDSVLQKPLTPADQQVRPDHLPPFRGYSFGIPAVKVYPSDNLRYKHLDLSIPRERGQPKLLKLLEHIGIIIEGDEQTEGLKASKETMVANATSVVVTSNSRHGHSREELSLRIDDHTGTGRMLDEQSRLLLEAIRGKGLGFDFTKPYRPRDVFIPILKLPAYSRKNARDYFERREYLCKLITDLSLFPELDLGPMRVKSSGL